MPEGTAPCVVKGGEVAVGEDGLNCDVEQGAVLRILGEGTAPADAPSKDEPPQEPPPSEPPPVEVSPPPKAAASSRPTPKVKPMEPEEVEVAAEAVEEAEAVVTEKPPKSAKSKGFHEEVGTPDAGVADLSQFTALAGDNGGLAVILSLIAVVGGGAAWKFYSQSSSQKHELEMAKLEKGQSDHAACEAKRMELAGRIDALERKFTGAIDLDAPSTTDLEKKIKNLERRLREVKSTKT